MQGGGAHGAFTWGVLDQILADGRLEVDGISGSSAGALNAVMLADGLARGGPPEAQRRLADFWRAASFDGNLPALQRGVLERLLSFLPGQHAPLPWLGPSPVWSPYDLNPLNINPLKDLIERFVDFDAVCAAGTNDLFITATNVLSGALHVFPRNEVTAEVVMASACLPLLFHAVEIDGVPYWDGGYSGNPALFPFLKPTSSDDVLIVQINPLASRKTPTSAREIMSRVNEITFNASLLAEMRAVELAGTLIDEIRQRAASRTNTGACACIGSSWMAAQPMPAASSTPISSSSSCCTSAASAPRGASSMPISGISDTAAPSMPRWPSRPRWLNHGGASSRRGGVLNCAMPIAKLPQGAMQAERMS